MQEIQEKYIQKVFDAKQDHKPLFLRLNCSGYKN